MLTRRLARLPQTYLLALLRTYKQVLSPWLPPACRFTPTCSEYAFLAIDRFGAWRGSGMALRRLSRCHPFHAGGFDPVPPAPPSPGHHAQWT